MDATLFRSMNRFAKHTHWLHAPMISYAKHGIVLFAIALAVGWLIGRQRSSTAAVASVACTVVAVFVALALAQLIGHVVNRSRPYDVMRSVEVLVDRTKDFSFPSDHATAVGAVAAGLWFVHRRLGLVVGALAALMAIARVYVGAHYPGDVLAGLVVGVGTAVLAHRLLGGLFTDILERLRATPLRPLVSADPPGR
jgi:membrane-associated phospholipid phosphatase